MIPLVRWRNHTASQFAESISILGQSVWIVTRVTTDSFGFYRLQSKRSSGGQRSLGSQSNSVAESHNLDNCLAAVAANRYTSPIMTIAQDNSPERLVSASRADEEQSFELKLRPRWLGEFIGQAKA